jgi:hypothetical protein
VYSKPQACFSLLIMEASASSLADMCYENEIAVKNRGQVILKISDIVRSMKKQVTEKSQICLMDADLHNLHTWSYMIEIFCLIFSLAIYGPIFFKISGILDLCID